MGYEYDVFVSYKHGRMFGEWVHDYFIELFKECLSQSLGREAKVFLDKRDIPVGDAWPERLKRSLAVSRCLVGVWSPLYFTSTWCRHECAVMLYREKKCGFRTIKNPQGLILPVVVHDGERFPGCVDDIQGKNFSDYARESLNQEAQRYLKFQDDLLPLAEDAARVANLAPPWNAEWLKEEWLDNTVDGYNFDLKPMPIEQPGLE